LQEESREQEQAEHSKEEELVLRVSFTYFPSLHKKKSEVSL